MASNRNLKKNRATTSPEILAGVNFVPLKHTDFCVNVQCYDPSLDEETVIVEEISQDATFQWLDTLPDTVLEHTTHDPSKRIQMARNGQEIEEEPVHNIVAMKPKEYFHYLPKTIVNKESPNCESKTQNVVDRLSKKMTKSVCEVCNKTFVSTNKLNWHKRMHDKNRKRFICPIEQCGRIYASKQSCDMHYKQTHLDEGFLCHICQKIFSAKQTLEVHMRYHKKDFPFKCNICERKFAQKGHLTQHIEVKHQNLRYICPEPECGKTFQNSVSLRNHHYTHSSMPFKCSHCEKQFPQKNKLRDHLLHKHNFQYSLQGLEEMRQFNIIRTRHAFVKVQVNASNKNYVKESVLENTSEMIVSKVDLAV